jgi:hypothetical protein
MGSTEEFKITVYVEQVANRDWKAESVCNGVKGIGTGSSKDIAVGKSASTVIRVLMEEGSTVEPAPVETQPFSPTHYVNYGRKEGQKYMATKTIATNEKGEVLKYYGQYEDGSWDEERARFLRPIKK